jgi:hypothetical protein
MTHPNPFAECDLRWVRQFPNPDDHIVWIDVAKVDVSWQRDTTYYVGLNGTCAPGGSGSKKSYDKFGAWIKDHNCAHVWMPHLGIGDLGFIEFTDGRHRFAWLRDHGVEAMPVSTSLAQEVELQRSFGTCNRVSRLKIIS